MISSTIYSDGKNNFKDHTFFAREWSAPIMVSPKDIRERLDSFSLCGRRIRRMRTVGLSCFHAGSWVDESADWPPDMQIGRSDTIDKPFMIEFEDGDIFEIDTPQESEFRMSMNCIPWEIGGNAKQSNIEADILFSPCIGQKVTAVEIDTYTTDKDPMFHELFDAPPYRRELVSRVTLRLENGTSLQIAPSIDYCKVSCIDANGKEAKMYFSELKKVLDSPNDEAESDMRCFTEDA